jgi:hypothetical protein
MRAQFYIDTMTRELARHGVDRWHIDRRHHHPRLTFEWNGRAMFYVMPVSSSDWRAVLNTRSDLRRILRAKDADQSAAAHSPRGSISTARMRPRRSGPA